MSRTTTTTWRKITRVIRAQGRQANLPCAICHGALGPIDYRTQGEADREARAAGRYWELRQPRPLALDVDHITPHVAGGTDTLDNAVQTHAVCNRRAGAKGTKSTARSQQPVNGHWTPKTGTGPSLPGRAKPGAQTATHVFTAGPTP